MRIDELCLGQSVGDFASPGKPACRVFREDELPIDFYIEYAFALRYQVNLNFIQCVS
jgi:hypothetical protein